VPAAPALPGLAADRDATEFQRQVLAAYFDDSRLKELP